MHPQEVVQKTSKFGPFGVILIKMPVILKGQSHEKVGEIRA
jgi:hypothetical protein